MPVRAAELAVGVTGDISGVMAAFDRVGWRMGILGRMGDETSGKWARMAAALTGVGITLGAAGVAGIRFFAGATQEAVKYNQASALTLTQTDQLGISLNTIKKIGRDVAMAIPAPFEEMQASLYDIFSSMDVNAKGAQTLLENFSRGAVAGQVKVQTAGRATIAIMNAFQIPVEKVSEVMDFQFQLVRKGVGTYEDFASTIGRSIPSAVRAGQSYETLGGMLAFLTRNGLSAAMASASSARALDLVSNPIFAKRMEGLGLSVADANGNFKPMVNIVQDLRGKLAGLPLVERAAVLRELTKGAGGTIQAMRFLSLATTGSTKELEAMGEASGFTLEEMKKFQGVGPMFDQLVSSMQNSAGAMSEQYDFMFKQPQTQIQRLKNSWQILRTEIGDQFIPVLQKFVDVGITLIDFFRKLSDTTKRNIAVAGAIASVFLLLAGFVLVVVGAMAALISVLGAVGITGGIAAAAAGGLMAALLLIPAAIYLLIKNWDTLKSKVSPVIDLFKRAADIIKRNLLEAFNDLKPTLKFIGAVLGGVVLVAIGLVVGALWALSHVVRIVADAWRKFTDYIGKHIDFDAIKKGFEGIKQKIADAFTIGPIDSFKAGLNGIKTDKLTPVEEVLKRIGTAFRRAGDAIKDLFTVGPIDAFLSGFNNVDVSGLTKIELWIRNIGGAVKWAYDRVTEIWDALKNFAASINLQPMVDGFFKLVDAVKGFFSGLNLGPAIESFKGLWSTIKESFSGIGTSLKELWDALKGLFDALGGWKTVGSIIKTVFKGIGVVLGVVIKVLAVVIKFLAEKFIPGVIDGLSVVIKFATGIIKAIIGFVKGVISGVTVVINFVKGIISVIVFLFKAAVGGFKMMVNTVKTAFTMFIGFVTSIPERIRAIWERIKAFAGQAVDAVVNFFVTLPERIAYWLGFLLARIAAIWLGIQNFLFVTVPTIISNVVTWFSELPGKVWTWLVDLWNKFIEWGANTLATITQFISDAATSFMTWLTGLPGAVWGWLVGVWEKFTQWGSDTKGSVTTTLSNIISEFTTWLGDLPEKVWGWIKGIATKFETAINEAKSFVSGGIDDVVGFFSGIGTRIERVIGNAIAIVRGIGERIGAAFTAGAKDGLQEGSPFLVERFFMRIADTVANETESVLEQMNRLNAVTRAGNFRTASSFVQSNHQPVAAGMAARYGGSVTVAEGAVQINIEGSVTPEAMPAFQDALDTAVGDLVQALRAR